MGVTLLTDSKMIRENIGLNIDAVTSQSANYLDGPRDRQPLLACAEKEKILLVREIELGNFVNGGCGENAINANNLTLGVYDSYFTMSNQGQAFHVYQTEGDALRNEYGIIQADAYTDMPYSRYCRVKESVDINLTDNLPLNDHYYVYEVDLRYVNEVFTTVDEKDVNLAMRMLKEYTHATEAQRKILFHYMVKKGDNLFDQLSHMMDEAGVDAIWFDTRLNIHLMTALPWETLKDGGIFGYYNKKKFYFITTRKCNTTFMQYKKEYTGFSELVDAIIVEDRIGIEEKNLPVGRVLAIGEQRCKDVTALLMLWRDRHANQMLAYYIINGIGNNYAMEKAVSYAAEILKNAVQTSERDVELRYCEQLQMFMDQFGVKDLELRKYFAGIQAGTRTPYPALPSDYLLHTNMKTLRLDCGAQLFRSGILLSGSDQARTLCLESKGSEVYALLGKLIRQSIIPLMRGGITGDEAYWRGMDELLKSETKLKKIGMLDTEFTLKESFNRNMGHTFSKTESNSATVAKNDMRVFEEQMIGCIEFQWPYQDTILGVEDMFFIAKEGPINFTY